MSAAEHAELADVARRKAAGEIDASEARAERAFILAHYREQRQFGYRTLSDDEVV